MPTNGSGDDSTRSLGDFDNKPDQPRIKRLGHFRIEATLGSGGMGTIYRAYDESMKRAVALKVLHSSLELSSQAQSRFVREAWIAGQLDHPNIVKVYSRGEENNVSYLAMELIEGGSLYDLMKKTRDQVSSNSDITRTADQRYIKDMLAKFVELARALEHIHSKGFIHRDIKPQNILLSGGERKLKFTDFGIAHAEDMTRMTRAGDFIGTVKYMSPELLAAHRAGVDNRTDIYSLGVTLYEVLTLCLPFRAESEEKLIGEILAGHYIEARKCNRRVPIDLETVLMKACHHDPGLRYQTAVEFADDLQRIIDDRPIMAKRPGMVTRGYKYIRRNYRSILGVIAVAGAVLISTIWFMHRVEEVSVPASDKPDFSIINVPGLLDYCALSPDGKRIAFATADYCVWVAPTRGASDSTVAGEAMKLTDSVGSSPLLCLPVWSADGNWIAFNGLTIAEPSSYWLSMYVVASDGGEVIEVPVRHNIVDMKRFWDLRLSLSPDGSEIAFFSHTSPITGDSLKNALYAMPVRGGEIRHLGDSLCEHPTYCGQPAYSPDGKTLAFVRGEQPCKLVDATADCDIWITPVDGGSPLQITDQPGVEFGPVWSPDSRKIAFSQWKETDIVDLCQISQLSIVSLSDEYAPLGPPEVVELPKPSDDYISGWCAGGEIGVVVETETIRNIYSISASGGIATMLRPSIARSPTWSPDGERIFYLGANNAYSVSAGGGAESLVPITGMKDIGFEEGCDISPDGKKLAITGIKEGDSVPHIFTVPIIGGVPDQITFGSSEDWNPRWSPNGEWIAFSRYLHSDDPRPHLCFLPAEGGEVVQLVLPTDSSGPGSGSKIDWSPDGESIAFPSYHGWFVRGISRAPVDGGAPEILLKADSASAPAHVSWSPDGEKIAYALYTTVHDETTVEIWILSLETRERHKLQMTGYELDVAYQPDWSPNSDKIVFSGRHRSRNALCLMRNFFPAR